MTTMAAQWLRLPLELRQRAQWLLAGPNAAGELKVPVTVDLSGKVRSGSSTDKSTWLDFEYAAQCAEELGYGLGYVLAAWDPYTCIDFDLYTAQNRPQEPAKWSTEEDFGLCHRISSTLQSYTEFSQSGIGAHTWVRANIGHGLQRGPVALYSQERFIACTGNVIYDLPIADRSEVLQNMALQMGADQQQHHDVELVEAGDELSDEEVLRRATGADNAGKFNSLWAGQWEDMRYPSQSEADLSLMSMLTFYSRSNEQCRRLFRRSALGQRAKAVENDRYLDYTLRVIRARQAKEDEAVQRIVQQSSAFLAQHYGQQPQGAAAPDPLPAGSPDATRAMAQAYAEELQAHRGPPPQPPTPKPPPPGGLPWPPGLVGRIAQFVYNAAPRPVKEVAIVAALGWMAGVCGKAWVIPGSGLNMYIILVARSGVGKEAMHGGLGALVSRLRESQPTAQQFINFNDFASGPALAKACSENSSFVNVAGEFGRKLQRLANNAHDGPMQSLRTVMTNLYQKSGPASIVGGITYSNKDSNIGSISGVAYSMIGETTPDTLYASLTESMMEDGFLSRFTIIEYNGPRPQANSFPNLVVPNDLVEDCHKLCHLAATWIGNHTRCYLQRTQAAADMMAEFDAECDAQINSSEDESWRQMWNRAHLKMVRIAGLLCIGDAPDCPVIDVPHIEWALDVVRRDIALMSKRLESGDVGQGDTSREKKLLHIMHEFLTKPLPPSYQVPAAMQRDALVPRKYLQMRVCKVASFSHHPMGTKRALDDAIQSCCDSGYIAEVDKNKVGEQYTFMGRCFRIVSLPKFN